jgi:hypothetical protein
MKFLTKMSTLHFLAITLNCEEDGAIIPKLIEVQGFPLHLQPK